MTHLPRCWLFPLSFPWKINKIKNRTDRVTEDIFGSTWGKEVNNVTFGISQICGDELFVKMPPMSTILSKLATLCRRYFKLPQIVYMTLAKWQRLNWIKTIIALHIIWNILTVSKIYHLKVEEGEGVLDGGYFRQSIWYFERSFVLLDL